MATTIRGSGRFLPPFVDRGGVQRPIAIDPVGPSTLAADAARNAFAAAGMGAGDIDFVIFATATPDVTFPGAGCYLQHHLECGTVGALDVRGQCAGFLYGLMIADQFVKTGTYDAILLAGAEVHSSGLDYEGEGASLARMFGDGAGVALLTPGDRGGVLSIDLHADGREHRRFWCEYPASRQHPVRFTMENLAAGAHFPRVDESALRQAGIEQLGRSMRTAIAAADRRPEQIDHFIVSHLFPDVAETALRDLGIEANRASIPSQRYGHIMGAALPVALDEDRCSGRIASGATICLAAAGAGETWGAAVIEL